MIYIIIEIALTIAAWNRGWKGWALLPAALYYLLSFTPVFMYLWEIADLFYLAYFGVLIWMMARERKPKVTVNPMVRPMAGNLGNRRFCMNCGQQQPDNAVFCRNCGYQLQNSPRVASNTGGQLLARS